jgi:ABC-type multidrug transport system permease subunit
MDLAAGLPLVVVIICAATLYGCYVVFDRLQTRIEQTHGRQRWLAIGLASCVGLIALLTFWCCFAFSAGLLQGLGLNL